MFSVTIQPTVCIMNEGNRVFEITTLGEPPVLETKSSKKVCHACQSFIDCVSGIILL